MKKKSLTQWQRQELSHWIDELLRQLTAMGLVDDSLADRLALRRARVMGIELVQDNELSPADQLERHFEEDARRFRERSFADVDGHDDEEDDSLAGITAEELAELLSHLREDYSDAAESVSKVEPAVPDNTVFKRLFRQTAAALHPDKASDNISAEDRHVLMSELLTARKHHDLLTILRLHERYAAAESTLTMTDEKQLEAVLKQYLDEQQNRREDIVMRSPMHSMVFHRFYDEKPSTVNRRVNQYLNELGNKTASMEAFHQEVTTLKRLKELLAERYDRFRYHW